MAIIVKSLLEQMIDSVWDIPNNRVRTDASFGAAAMAIKDGATETRAVVRTTAPEAGDAGLVVRLVDGVGGDATTVTEDNIPLVLANTEYSWALPPNCCKVIFRCRMANDVRYAWSPGKVAGPTAPYQTLRASAEYAIDGIRLTGKTIYFASDTAGNVIEIEAWS